MRSRAVLLACVAVMAPAVAASAAHAVEVARAGESQLLASDEKKQLCIAIDFALDTSCAKPRESVVVVSGAEAGESPVLGAAVPAAAASVEVRRAGVLLASAPTVAGEAYKGVRAGTVRFALVRLPKATRADGLRVRALNAAGALVEVLAPEDDAELVVSRKRLLSGRARGVEWKLTLERVSELEPSVLDLEHESPSTCVVTELNGEDRGRACKSGAPFNVVDVVDLAKATSAATCNRPFRLLHGVVDPSVTSVTVLLGDGRRRTVSTVPAGDGMRTYAVATGIGAVRSVTLAGRGVVRTALAPLSALCTDSAFLLILIGRDNPAFGPFALLANLANLPSVTPAGPIATIPGSPGMQVADGAADTLCITIAGRPFKPLGCGVPSPVLGEELGVLDDILDPRAFAVAVPVQVAAVRLSSADRKRTQTMPTVAGAEYRGRYAGHLRFASATLANSAELTRLELLDAAGNVLVDESADEEENLTVPTVGRSRRLAGRPGAPSLWQTNVRDAGGPAQHCLTLTAGPEPSPLDNCRATRETESVLLDASCVTHRLSVGFAVRPGTRVVAHTGGSMRRAVRLRRGYGVLTLAGTQPLRAVTFIRKGRSRRVAIEAPPAAKQCGWNLSPLVYEE